MDTTEELLRLHEYFQDIDDDVIADVAAHMSIRRFESGDCVLKPHVAATSVSFIVRGRLKQVLLDGEGREQFVRFAERGDQVGLLLTALAEPLPLRIDAVEPSVLLDLPLDDALDLASKYPVLRHRWRRSLAGDVRTTLTQERTQRKLTVLAVMGGSAATRGFTRRLALRLNQLGETIAVFHDQAELPEGILQAPLGAFDENKIRQQLNEWPRCDRVILDLDPTNISEAAQAVFELCDRMLWCLTVDQAESMATQLRRAPIQPKKSSLVWLLEDGQTATYSSELRGQTIAEFQVAAGDSANNTMLSQGLERVVHELRGVRVGLALGGGAALGMAHLGVMETLQQQGVVVDMIAGTSAGAMTGILAASGMDPSHCAECFAHDLKPSFLFRMLPGGAYWYLVDKYRRRRFAPMLRRYLGDLRLEQLPLPAAAVTVDLVRGKEVIREGEYDAVQAILESINLPVLARPICRNGEALIDGGFVDNVPAKVLTDRGCNFIIAVDVMTNIEQRFGRNTPDTPTNQMRAPGILQTLMRTHAVQNYNLNDIGSATADMTIAPDVSRFDMAAFTDSVDIARAGAEATASRVSELQGLLERRGVQSCRAD